MEHLRSVATGSGGTGAGMTATSSSRPTLARLAGRKPPRLPCASTTHLLPRCRLKNRGRTEANLRLDQFRVCGLAADSCVQNPRRPSSQVAGSTQVATVELDRGRAGDLAASSPSLKFSVPGGSLAPLLRFPLVPGSRSSPRLRRLVALLTSGAAFLVLPQLASATPVPVTAWYMYGTTLSGLQSNA